MKKTLIKLFAVVLAFCVIAPQMAFAAATYSVTVTLAGPDVYGVNQTVSRKSPSYLKATDSLVAAVAQAMLSSGYDEEVELKFDGTELRTNYYSIRSAAVDASGGNGAVWNGLVEQYVENNAAKKAVLKNINSTIYDLEKVGGVITSYYSGGYTVTMTLNKQGEDEEPTVVIKNEDDIIGGDIEISNPNPDPGDVVEIKTIPEEKKIVSYVQVRDDNGDLVELTYIGNGEYSFEMPEGGVTITPSFRTEPALPSVTGVSAYLDVNSHEAFMQGDKKGTFRPNADINRAEVAQMFYNILLDTSAVGVSKFNDVDEDAWYAEAINTLAAMGMIGGYTDGSFQPKRAITRAEFASLCVRFAKSVAAENIFSDVDVSHWAAGDIAIAASFGWILGYEDGTFRPEETISREEAAAIFNRMLYRIGDQIKIDGGANRDFPDVNDRMWSWYDVQEAVYGHDHTEEEEFVHEFWED